MSVNEDLIRRLGYEWINGDNSQYKRMEWLFYNSKKHRIRTKNLNRLKKVHPKYKLYQIIEDVIDDNLVDFQKEVIDKYIS